MGTYELPKREIKFRYFNNGKMEFYSYEDNSMWALHEIVYPERLMQYTGLKDKLGKEVYEGDICKQIDPYNQNFPIETGIDYILQIHTLVEWGIYYKLEVIGNVFENPELLKTNNPTT